MSVRETVESTLRSEDENGVTSVYAGRLDEARGSLRAHEW